MIYCFRIISCILLQPTRKPARSCRSHTCIAHISSIACFTSITRITSVTAILVLPCLLQEPMDLKQLSFAEWLVSMDPSEGLHQYLACIEESYDTVSQMLCHTKFCLSSRLFLHQK